MGVEFDEHQPLGYNYPQKKVGGGGLTPLLIKIGLAKDQASAQKVMIIIAIICFILSIYFFFKI